MSLSTIYMIPDSFVRGLADSLSCQLQKEIEVIEMAGDFSHNPETIRVYIQPSNDFYYLFFIDANGEPRAIYLQTSTYWSEEGPTVRVEELKLGSGQPVERMPGAVGGLNMFRPKVDIGPTHAVFRDETQSKALLFLQGATRVDEIPR